MNCYNFYNYFREKANQVYTEIMKVESATEQPVQIGNRFVSFRKLVDLLQLECKLQLSFLTFIKPVKLYYN